jgi:hypothetical protein
VVHTVLAALEEEEELLLELQERQTLVAVELVVQGTVLETHPLAQVDPASSS